MERIKILHHDRCHYLEIGQTTYLKNVKIRKIKESFYVENEKGKIPLTQKGVSLDLNGEEMILSLSPLAKEWFLFPLQNDTEIGRDASCTIMIDDITISKHHFKISQDQLNDLGSKNGTYVNGRKIRQVKLSPGDHIVFGNQEAYWIDSILITSFPISKEKMILPKYPLASFSDVYTRIKEEKTVTVLNASMESPQLFGAIKKMKWFQAIGSSFLILFSGLISSVVVILWMPDQLYSLISLLINSISMCFAFALYGLWNRHSNYKEQYQEKKKQEEKYLEYCQHFQEDIEQVRLDMRKSIQDNLSYYSFNLQNFHNQSQESMRLCIGYQKQDLVHIEFRKPNYLQINEPLFQKQIQIIKLLEEPLETPIYIEENHAYWIAGITSEVKEALFLQWVLTAYDPGRKWVWIDSDMSIDNPFLAHPACRIGRRLLWIKTQDDWERWKNEIDPQFKYILFINESFVQMQSLSFSTWISTRPLEKAIKINKERLWFEKPPNHFYRKILRKELETSKEENPILSLFQDSRKDDQSNLLRVYLGTNRNGDKVELDLSESKQGPHGFIAGMTGSGKSELLSNILFQLVYRNSPKDIQFLLIDFKGGAFGQAFYRFEHCKGYLTNLDHEEMERFLFSIRSFLEERQKILMDFVEKHPGAKAHIDSFNKINRDDRMAHILLIVDEMAQLKSAFPDFVNQLKEIARIGRSLGIHCLLSTQKPMGVIDEQIWANTSFKICLQVSSKMDSFEVLHNENAANLQHVGQFILQVQGEQEEIEGTSFYLGERIERYPDGFTEIDEKGNPLRSHHQETWSIFDALSTQIPLRDSHSSWIVSPFDQSAFQEHEWALIDHPEYREMEPLRFRPGIPLLLWSSDPQETKAWIDSLGYWCRMPVYGVNPIPPSCYMEEVLDNRKVSRITEFYESSIWIIDGNTYAPLQVRTLLSKQVILIVCMNKIDEKSKLWLSLQVQKLCIDFSTVEEVRSFFQCFVPQGMHQSSFYAYYLENQKMRKVLLHQVCAEAKPLFKKSKAYQLKEKEQGLYLGFDAQKQQEIYWTMERILLIGFVQKYIGPRVDKMVKNWQQQYQLSASKDLSKDAMVYIVDFLTMSDLVYKEKLVELAYNADILWLGKGAREHAYLLKRKAPDDENAYGVFWMLDKRFELIKEGQDE